ncbi:MAG TPA: PHB depolymerase family esterase, partial [Candidatus Binatia bacterium]|nr:PHB depolymerase family esterase [Candidatus Binatia bacterium]
MRAPSAVLLLLAAAPVAAAIAPGLYDRELQFGGATRNYKMRVPAGYDGSVAVPLVVDLHGFLSNAMQQAGISGMATVAERETFVLVHPNGLNNAWNAGICCGNRGVDDVGFLRQVVAAVEAEVNVDARRIYATGLSNGGAMTHRLACDAADLFAAAAPMAFPVPFRPLTGCRPSRAIPVLTFMGLTDTLVHYEGGPFPSAPETFAYWRDIDGCGDGAPDQRVEQGLSRCETYTSCTNGVQAGLCSITARSFGGSPIDGHVLYLNDDFVLADVAWSFLKQFTLPDARSPVRGSVTGTSRLGRRGERPTKETVTWAVTFGDGTWVVEDAAAGTVYTGSARRLRRGRRVVLGLTADARTALLGVLAAKRGEALTLGDTKLVARVSRRRLQIGGRV